MLDKFIALVKGQISHYENQVARFSPNHPRYRPDQIAMYRRLIAEHRDLLAFLEDQYFPQRNSTPPDPQRNPTPPDSAITLPPAAEPTFAERSSTGVRSDLSDLPPELLAELSESARGEVDQLVKIIDDRGGIASLDEILIDLYRKHKEIGKRNIVANKLYRLSKRDMVWSVAGKKGVYTTSPATTGEAEEADDNAGNENFEGSDARTSEPSNSTGAAGLQEGPSKPTPIGSNPTVSTKNRRDLFAGTSISTAASLAKKGETRM